VLDVKAWNLQIVVPSKRYMVEGVFRILYLAIGNLAKPGLQVFSVTGKSHCISVVQ
jgi:hypothetical protein